MNKTVGVGIGVVVAIAIVFVLITNEEDVTDSDIEEIISEIEIDKSAVNSIANDVTALETPISPYKYQTICDLGSTPEEIMMEPRTVFSEIIEGMHNDNKHVIEFFKTNELLSTLNTTPDEMLIKPDTQSEKSSALAPNYDPIFYDMIFWMPVILQVMEVHPDVVHTLTVQKNDSMQSYEQRVISESRNCQ